MAKAKDAPERAHKATYARDKKKGGYIIRVAGPQCHRFAGRTVPVEIRGGGEHDETLTDLIWTGTDDGEISGYTGPVALYNFEAKPKQPDDEIPF
jgi:hypothetical protein